MSSACRVPPPALSDIPSLTDGSTVSSGSSAGGRDSNRPTQYTGSSGFTSSARGHNNNSPRAETSSPRLRRETRRISSADRLNFADSNNSNTPTNNVNNTNDTNSSSNMSSHNSRGSHSTSIRAHRAATLAILTSSPLDVPMSSSDTAERSRGRTRRQQIQGRSQHTSSSERARTHHRISRDNSRNRRSSTPHSIPTPTNHSRDGHRRQQPHSQSRHASRANSPTSEEEYEDNTTRSGSIHPDRQARGTHGSTPRVPRSLSRSAATSLQCRSLRTPTQHPSSSRHAPPPPPASRATSMASHTHESQSRPLSLTSSRIPVSHGRKPKYTPRPSSIYSRTPSRRSMTTVQPKDESTALLEEMRHEIMANYLYQQQCAQMWVVDSQGEAEGCLVRKVKGRYVTCPPRLIESPFARSMAKLNVQCAITINTGIIKAFISWSPDAVDVPLGNGQRIQMVHSMDYVAYCRKAQNAAFVKDQGLLVVWDDEALHLISRAVEIEKELMKLVWSAPDDAEAAAAKASKPGQKVIPRAAPLGYDKEGQVLAKTRPVKVMNSFLLSLTLALIMLALGAALRHVSVEVMSDGFWPRLGILGLYPMQIFFSLFFAQVIFGSLAQIMGPIRQLEGNSKFFSAELPPRLRNVALPHVTIQCPVYKEGLHAVIAPTIRSLKAAMTTYELQGGSVNLFVNDDGLQLLDAAERRARINFYADNNIGWVARPPHGEKGFQRRGKFKKASNMNFALYVSNTVEDLLARLWRGPDWTNAHESRAYSTALKTAIASTGGGAAWADGNIRMGDYILLVDSDTRVPGDCLLDAVSEMQLSPEVAILQFSSGVMQVVHNFFENGITFFTNMINSAIRYTVANGDASPFVGHNAILRWTALQAISYQDADGYEKIWSESHVSEDFDMSLRLQSAGYIIRLAAWAGEGFKEGVSLTVYDELARWEKYAYGCNELLFNPLRLWLARGPFTRLFWQFLTSGIPMASKVTIMAYIGTYYAIAAAWILTTVNYFMVGWWQASLDRYYIDSWQVWFSIIIVFNGLGNMALAVMRYRVNEKRLLYALYENFKWTVMLAIFLGGLSLHLSAAILAHMFEIDMAWGATAKEFAFSNFFIEVPKVLRKFKVSIFLSFLFVGVMVFFATSPAVPYGWEIRDFGAILPMATVATSHVLLPIALNPALMTFSW